ncbi:hypothetical protein EDF65_3599 [Chryseobacterium nakagawai]|nr:hypothetical protein EDF65_3599 [Chryseobacterium nakagawai]
MAVFFITKEIPKFVETGNNTSFLRKTKNSMKQILLLSLSVLMLISCQKKNQNQAKEQEDLPMVSASKVKVPILQKNYETLQIQGRVKSIEVTGYQQSILHADMEHSVTKTIYKFDESGNLAEETAYLQNNEFGRRYQYYYDAVGNAVKTVGFEESDKKKSVNSLTLNEKGIVVSDKKIEFSKTKNNEDTIRRREYINNIKEMNDAVLSYSSYEKSKPKQTTQWIKQYKNGNLISEKISNNLPEGETETTYSYDSNNNLIMQEETGLYPIVRKWKYDKKGNEIYQQVVNDKENIFSELKKTFDEYGNITKLTVIENGKIDDRVSVKYEYTYDSQHNWIQMKRFTLNGSKISVTDRKIVYY